MCWICRSPCVVTALLNFYWCILIMQKNWLHNIFTDAYNMLLANELTIQFSEVQMAKKYTQKLLTVFNHGRNDNQTFETPPPLTSAQPRWLSPRKQTIKGWQGQQDVEKHVHHWQERTSVWPPWSEHGDSLKVLKKNGLLGCLLWHSWSYTVNNQNQSTIGMPATAIVTGAGFTVAILQNWLKVHQWMDG